MRRCCNRLREGSLKNPSQTVPLVIYDRKKAWQKKNSSGRVRCPTGPVRAKTGALILSDRSDRSDTSATPPRPAHHRCHQKSLAYPNGTSSPEPFQTAAQQTHGVYSGAPTLSIWSIWSIWSICKRHTTAPRTPPLPSKKPCIPQRHIFARVIPNSGTANPQGITWLATA